jgi:hypothetical protein
MKLTKQDVELLLFAIRYISNDEINMVTPEERIRVWALEREFEKFITNK